MSKASRSELYHLAKTHGFENRTGKKLIDTDPEDWERFLKQCYTNIRKATSTTTFDGRFIKIHRQDGSVIILDKSYKGEEPKAKRVPKEKKAIEPKKKRPKCPISGYQKGTKKYAAFYCFAKGASVKKAVRVISKKFGDTKLSSIKSWYSKFAKLFPDGVSLPSKTESSSTN